MNFLLCLAWLFVFVLHCCVCCKKLIVPYIMQVPLITPGWLFYQTFHSRTFWAVTVQRKLNGSMSNLKLVLFLLIYRGWWLNLYNSYMGIFVFPPFNKKNKTKKNKKNASQWRIQEEVRNFSVWGNPKDTVMPPPPPRTVMQVNDKSNNT